MKNTLYLALVYFLILSTGAVASNKALPSLSDFLEPQLKCQPNHSLNKQIETSDSQLQPLIWSIAADLKFDEIKSDEPNSRVFKGSYRELGRLQCGMKVYGGRGGDIEHFTFKIKRSEKQSDKIDFSITVHERDVALSPFIAQDLDENAPADGEAGYVRPCFIRMEDFLKNKDLISADSLCKNKPAKKRYTQAEINLSYYRWIGMSRKWRELESQKPQKTK